MTMHLGDVSADRVLYIPFASYGADGQSITLSGLAVTDIEIYKLGGTTQRSSDSGYALLDTDGIDFDGITGIHGFSIDLQDDTDTGFFSVGAFYWVVVSAVTINAQTVNFIAATFRIVAMEGVTGHPKADISAIRGDEQSAIDLKDFADAGYDPGTNKVQGVVLTDTATNLTNLPSIPNNWLTAAGTAVDFSTELRTAINGGDYALSTDANGRIRIVDGTGTGELNTASGSVDVVTIEGSDATDQINAACDAAIETYGLQYLLSAAVAGANVTDNSIIAKLVSKSATADWDSFVNTTDALEALRDRGDAAWTTATGFSTHSAADVWASVSRTLTALDEDSTTIDLDAAIRAAVGLASANLDTQLDALPTANEVRNAVTGGAYALSTDANGMVRIVDGTGSGELNTSGGFIAGIAGTINTLDALDAAQDVEHDATQAAIAALNNISVANVLTTQMTEAYAANGVAPTLAQALFAIHQKLMQHAYSGTSSNTYKLDNATLAFVGTLDDATSPTSDRRA